MNKKKGALEAIEDNATRLSGDKPLFKVMRLRVYMQIPLYYGGLKKINVGISHRA